MFYGMAMEPFVLIEGEDYTLEDGEGPVLLEPGYQRMGDAHAVGRDVLIQIDDVVIFRYPAK
jgi:hypothetical protein